MIKIGAKMADVVEEETEEWLRCRTTRSCCNLECGIEGEMRGRGSDIEYAYNVLQNVVGFRWIHCHIRMGSEWLINDAYRLESETTREEAINGNCN